MCRDVNNLVAPAALADVASANPPPLLVAERATDAALVDRLIDDAFGPGRFVKTAERLRETNAPLLDLSFVAWAGERPVGCVRQWPIHIGGSSALLLGPFAVVADYRGRGLGADLIRRACDAAAAAGHTLILLVGDAPFFSRLGFEAVPPGQVTLPGPVNPRRLLWRALAPGATEGVAGAVRPG